MKQIYKKLLLDVYDITSQLSLSVKRGTTLKGVEITLVDDGKIYEIPDDCYAVFTAKGDDHTFLSDSCIIQDNKIIYDFSETLVNTLGKNDCEITLYGNDGNNLTSPRFYIFVFETVQGEAATEIVKSDDFTVLTKLISDAREVISDATEATEATNEAIENAEAATEEARASVCYLKKTEDGKIQILNADLKLIDEVEMSYMDHDTIYRYENGILQVRGIKELNANETYRMWVGTDDEYLSLTEKQEGVFYWITDDETYDLLVAKVNELVDEHNELVDEHNALIDGLENGKFIVKNAAVATEAERLKIRYLYNYSNLDLLDYCRCDYCWTPTPGSHGDEYVIFNSPVASKVWFYLEMMPFGWGYIQELTTIQETVPRKFIRVYNETRLSPHTGWKQIF